MGIYDRLVIFSAVLSILILELYALSKGVNGTALSVALTGLGAIGGWFGKSIKDRRLKK